MGQPLPRKMDRWGFRIPSVLGGYEQHEEMHHATAKRTEHTSIALHAGYRCGSIVEAPCRDEALAAAASHNRPHAHRSLRTNSIRTIICIRILRASVA